VQDPRPRFLLDPGELSKVIRFDDQIRWGTEETEKRKFVKLSRRREVRRGFGAMAGLLTAFVVVWGLIDLANRREHQSLLATWGLPRDLYGHLGQLEELTLPGTVTRLDWLSRAKRLKKLTVEDGVLESLEGVPAGLETLTVGESRLSDLSGLPPSLTSLTLGANRIRTFAGLSERLSSLDLDLANDSVVVLGTLASSLRSLRLVIPAGFSIPDFRRLGSLQSLTLSSNSRPERFSSGAPPVALPRLRRDLLPAGLRSLKLEAGYPSFDDFPPTLRSLSLQGGEIPPLSKLPPAIESLELDSLFLNADGSSIHVDGLDVRAPEIDCSHLRALRSLAVQIPLESGVRLRRLPDRLVSLKVVSAWVVLSEQLPRDLKELEIRGRVLGVGRDEDWINRESVDLGNRVSDLRLPSGLESLTMAWLPPRLPESLKRLKAPQLQDVALPAGLRSLDLSGGWQQELPRLPDGLTELNLRATGVPELPGNLQSLTHLDISFTPIETLDDLPPSLKSLGLGTRQIETLQGLPESVTALHFHRRISPEG